MDTAHVCALLAAAFAGVLPAHLPTCRQRGWPVGSLFANQTFTTFMWLGVMAFLVGIVVTWALHDRVSWLWLLWILGVSFIGAAFVPVVFKSWSGAIALVAAPVLAVAACFLK